MMRLVSESLQGWVESRHKEHSNTMTGGSELMFRPLMRWFDRNAEDIFTQALQQVCRQCLLKVSGQ